MDYKQIVFNAAKSCGLGDVQAKIIVAQAIHESGNFTSHVFKTDNNLFGMKMPSVRSKEFIDGPSTIIKVSEGSTPYAHYDSVENSVKDLILSYHEKTNWSKINTPEDYAILLKGRGYFGDTLSNYTNALIKYFGSLPIMKYAPPLFMIFAIVGLGIYFLSSKN